MPEEAIRKANAISAAAGEPLGITLDERGPNKPATNISWFEAARFVNWLNISTGNAPAYKFNERIEVVPRGGIEIFFDFALWAPEDPGFDPENRFRNTRARYFLPSVDEWCKAAFYDPELDRYFEYPTGSNEIPTPVSSGTDLGSAVYRADGPADVLLAGGESPFGTIGQGATSTSSWRQASTS